VLSASTFYTAGFSFVHFSFNHTVGIEKYYVGDRILNESGAVGGMKIDKRNGSILRNFSPAPFRSPQTPLDLTWEQTTILCHSTLT
jgi:hypothetical protein